MRPTYRSDLSEEGYKDWVALNSFRRFAGLAVGNLAITRICVAPQEPLRNAFAL